MGFSYCQVTNLLHIWCSAPHYILLLRILWISVWTGLFRASSSPLDISWDLWILRLCSTESSTSWNVPNGVSSPGPLLGTFGHSFVQPGPPGSTVSWHYLGESSTNLLKDWMQKSQKVISAAVCGQSNRLASPVSREEEVTLSLWARAGIQWDYIWTKSSMCQYWSVFPTQRCFHFCDPLWSSAGVHGSSLVSILS